MRITTPRHSLLPPCMFAESALVGPFSALEIISGVSDAGSTTLRCQLVTTVRHLLNLMLRVR
jgi:hypothetical protein